MDADAKTKSCYEKKKPSAENMTEYTEQPENLEFYLNHLKILCNNEDKAYDYFIKWNAQMVQQPAEKSTCITIRRTLINYMR